MDGSYNATKYIAMLHWNGSLKRETKAQQKWVVPLGIIMWLNDKAVTNYIDVIYECGLNFFVQRTCHGSIGNLSWSTKYTFFIILLIYIPIFIRSLSTIYKCEKIHRCPYNFSYIPSHTSRMHHMFEIRFMINNLQLSFSILYDSCKTFLSFFL